MKPLTELEGCVLGIVWNLGPCTPYTIRRVFAESKSPFWTGSAGAIYPLVMRLERLGLIRFEPCATGRRPARSCILTPAGFTALRAWLGPPLPAWVVGVPMDALRTRLTFLMALPARGRDRFLTEAEQGVRSHIRSVEEECARQRARGDRIEYLLSRGALETLRCRIAWIREVRSGLAKAPPRARAAGRRPARSRAGRVGRD